MMLQMGRADLDEAALVAEIGALPDAPLAMPKQTLERRAARSGLRQGWIARLVGSWPARGAQSGHSGN